MGRTSCLHTSHYDAHFLFFCCYFFGAFIETPRKFRGSLMESDKGTYCMYIYITLFWRQLTSIQSITRHKTPCLSVAHNSTADLK